MKSSEIKTKSRALQINWLDVVKVTKAFLWSATSLALTLIGAVIALPETDIPEHFLWMVASAPFLNAVLYGIQRWLTDNR